MCRPVGIGFLLKTDEAERARRCFLAPVHTRQRWEPGQVQSAAYMPNKAGTKDQQRHCRRQFVPRESLLFGQFPHEVRGRADRDKLRFPRSHEPQLLEQQQAFPMGSSSPKNRAASPPAASRGRCRCRRRESESVQKPSSSTPKRIAPKISSARIAVPYISRLARRTSARSTGRSGSPMVGFLTSLPK